LANKASETGYLAKVHIKFNPDLGKVVNKALKPEIESQFSDRTKVSMEQVSSGLKMTFEATDIVALRAAVNSYLRWIQGILNIVEDINVH
jgi:tRNA threonylcarbamoyladenosine modification (KEOPS) complex  Pcc1 subunit